MWSLLWRRSRVIAVMAHYADLLIFVWRRRALALVALLLLLVGQALLLLPVSVAVRGSGALLLLLLPGALLACWWFAGEADPLTTAFLALCGALALPVPLLLALQWLPGTLAWWLLPLCSGLTALLAGALPRHEQQEKTHQALAHVRPQALLWLLVGVLLVGALLRLPALGAAELGGDEALVLRPAVDVVAGDDEGLLLRRKGPGEVLLPAGILAISGVINEGVARLPFALAGLGVLLACVLLGRELLRGATRTEREAQAVGLLAAALLALDGLLIAYSRIVQYQSVVVLMMAAALLCCWRFYVGVGNSRRNLLAAALCAAVALLCHYDGALVLPALCWLTLAGAVRRRWRMSAWLAEVGPPLLLGAALIASFYLPFIAHDGAARTANYLLWRAAGSREALGTLFNNLGSYYGMLTFYSTTFQVVPLLVLLVGAICCWIGRVLRPRPLAATLAALWLTSCVAQLLVPGLLIINGTNWALVAFGLPLAALCCAPMVPTGLRALLLAFVVPFVVMGFVLRIPNGHFYTVHLPAALLAALAAVQLWGWLGARQALRAQLALAAFGAAVALLALPYLRLAFLHQDDEYLRTFPEMRPPIYTASYGDELPSGSFLGFPHRDGWKVVGELYRQGVLEGGYQSNQKARITRWYIRDATPSRDPEYYFAALLEYGVAVPPDYYLWGYVEIDGRRTLEIYSRRPPDQPTQMFTLEYLQDNFDRWPLGSGWPKAAPPVAEPLQADFADVIRLRGYAIDTDGVRASSALTLTLEWRSLARLPDDYSLFVHLIDTSGQRVAQVDVPPAGPDAPTSRWLPGQYYSLVQRLPLPAALPPGSYHLALGLYHPATFKRLPIRQDTQHQETLPHILEDALMIGPITLP